MIGNTREPIWAMLVAAMPFATAASVQQETAVVTGKAVADAQIEYDNNGRTLLYCRLRHPTPDQDVNQALCDMVERCVTNGAVARDKTAACIKPMVARLAAYVDAGLLQALPSTQGDPGGSSDEITVTGKRPSAPQAGLWVFKETGTRRKIGMAAGAAPQDYESLDRQDLLPTRTWRMCVKDDALTDTLAAMLRAEPNMGKRAPCGWTIKNQGGQFEGTQRCMSVGAMIDGKLVGEQDASHFVAYKETNIRGLISLSRSRVMTDASTPSSAEGGLDERSIGIGQFTPKAGDRYRESTEVTGYRSGGC